MSKRFITSDLHLGHKNINKYRDRLEFSVDNDEYIIDKILSLGKRDILMVLGDFLFDGEHYKEYIQRLSKKSCRIQLILGNHDSLKLLKEDIFEIQLPLYQKKNIWLSHCPIHPQEMRNRLGNCHGHLHQEKVMISKQVSKYGGIITETEYYPDPKYFNVNIDVNNYEFIDFKEVEEYFN